MRGSERGQTGVERTYRVAGIWRRRWRGGGAPTGDYSGLGHEELRNERGNDAGEERYKKG